MTPSKITSTDCNSACAYRRDDVYIVDIMEIEVNLETSGTFTTHIWASGRWNPTYLWYYVTRDTPTTRRKVFETESMLVGTRVCIAIEWARRKPKT